MPLRPLHVADGAVLRAVFARVRAELGVPEAFPAEVLRAAHEAADQPVLPKADATDLPLITIDPPGSMDLDQALHITRSARGYRVLYAIADAAAFVRPGGVVDAETHLRGVTLYSPDERTPLHPPVLGEKAASLLPGEPRPALLWTMDLDAAGALVSVDVRRALVSSKARLDYAAVQQRLDDGTAEEALLLLREVGRLREEREHERGAVNLEVPEQEVERDDAGSYRLAYRAPLPVEGWNAQISLLTGMAAAKLMLEARIGVLRTLPPADPRAVESLRRSASALDVPWPDGLSYPDFVRSLSPRRPAHAALLQLATALLRGAGYAAFDGTLPEHVEHSAVAAPYAHATAPLRRLVDRYVGETCLALSAGGAVPDWVRETLPRLPGLMEAADRRSHALEHAIIDAVEAVLLAPHVGQTFTGVVVDANHSWGTVQLREPAVRGRCEGAGLPLGERIRVRLVEADPVMRTVRFEPA
jgi:exoribonuclease R